MELEPGLEHRFESFGTSTTAHAWGRHRRITSHARIITIIISLTHGLLGGWVVIVKLAAEEGQPLTQVQDPVVHEVTGAGLDHEDPLVREVLGQARCDHTSGRASADDDIVEAVSLVGSEVRGRHLGRYDMIRR